MEFLKKLKTRTEEIAQEAERKAEKLWNETIKVPSDERERRLAICLSCEFLESMNRCKKCGCFMDVKTWLPLSECPAKKWESYHIEVTNLDD